MEHSVDDLIAAAHPESNLMPGVNGIIEQKSNIDHSQSHSKAVRDNVRELNEKMENLKVQPGRFSRGKFLWDKK